MGEMSSPQISVILAFLLNGSKLALRMVTQ